MKAIKPIAILFLILVTSIISAQDNYESELISKFNKGVYIVAEVSDSNVKLKDSLTVTYKLYVSQDIGISNYNVQNHIENEDFEVEDINPSNTKIEYEFFKNEKYRFVILKKSVLKPKQKGQFKLEALALDVTAEIASKSNDAFGRLIMEKVNRTIKTDNITINVI
tara:strand:- start:1100 stop:1597 length:498 start_codon:yes stop_codon:yes gene_type:complete